MAARIEVAVNAEDVADARRKAQALRARVAGKRSNAKVEVDAGALKSILKVVDAVSSQLPRREKAVRGTKAGKATVLADEISPQEAADILQMSRPSVMRLIEKGLLHPRKVLSRNKLLRAEVEAFQAVQTRQQRRALSNLVTLTEDYDF
jgi:DNA-directed RNA polymerase specialized sigma24 family protein